jgi:5-hydroxyisourate hydrolase-like protein (transthyretin family)
VADSQWLILSAVMTDDAGAKKRHYMPGTTFSNGHYDSNIEIM